MRFLIDENIRIEVIEFLTKEGHDVKSVPKGYKNGQIAILAKEEKRILLTHDKHFADIFTYPPKEFFGIIRIRIHPPTAENIISALSRLLKKLSDKDLLGRLLVLEKDDFRIR